MNIFMQTNGCPRRQADASRLMHYFTVNGCKMVNKPRLADYIIFVSCSVVKSVGKASWKAIGEFKRYKGKLIVLGCLPGVDLKFDQRFKGRYLATKDLNRIDTFFDKFKFKFSDVPDTGFVHPATTDLTRVGTLNIRKVLTKFSRRDDFFRQRLNPFLKGINKENERTALSKKVVYLRISHGCVENCSFCGITRAIGRLKSKPVKDLAAEYRKFLAKGFRRFIILADNTGAYGLDIGSTFEELLESLLIASKNFRVQWHLEQMHPRWMLRYKTLVTKLVKTKKIRKISCSIQSGSNRILKLMNRGHTIEEITTILLQLRKCNPGLKLRTEIIAGFPTETKEDFSATLIMLRKIRFNYVFVYPYTDVCGTRASLYKKTSSEVTYRRVEIVNDLIKQEKMLPDFLYDW